MISADRLRFESRGMDKAKADFRQVPFFVWGLAHPYSWKAQRLPIWSLEKRMERAQRLSGQMDEPSNISLRVFSC